MKKEQLYKIANYLITGMIIFSIAIVLLAAFSIIPYYPHRLETIFNRLAGLVILIWLLGTLTIGLSYFFLVPDSLKLIKEKFTKKKEAVKEKDETNVKVEEGEEEEVKVEVVEEVKEQKPLEIAQTSKTAEITRQKLLDEELRIENEKKLELEKERLIAKKLEEEELEKQKIIKEQEERERIAREIHEREEKQRLEEIIIKKGDSFEKEDIKDEFSYQELQSLFPSDETLETEEESKNSL